MIKSLKPKTLPTLLTLNVLISGCAVLSSCFGSLTIRLYESRVDKGGLYRAQSNELVPWADTDKKFACMTWEDYEAMKNYCSRK